MATESTAATPPKPKTTPENPNPETKKKTLDLNDTDSGEDADVKKEPKGGAVASAANEAVEKKMKRAERFGVPVHLSDEEKRNSRAHRFGTAAGSDVSKASEVSNAPEDLKRKARAERFGISAPSDEDTKKKARLERFGSDKKLDAAEEEKRKTRALRFSQAPTNVVSHVNGNGDSVPKTAVAGNATGGA